MSPFEKYGAAVQASMTGDQNPALQFVRECRSLEKTDALVETLLRLVSTRLALKSGHLEISVLDEVKALPQVTGLELAFLNGEIHFVNGLLFLNRALAAFAAPEFARAAECYAAAGFNEKSLLSRYNAAIARIETDPTFDNDQIQAEMMALTISAREGGFEKIEALCARQLSYLYFDAHRFNAAKDFAQRACAIFAKLGPVSDYGLMRAHLSLIAWKTDERAGALLELEQIPLRPDERLQFPVALLNHLLHGTELNPKLFGVMTGRWQANFERFAKPAHALKTVIWNLETGVLLEQRKILGRIRAGSREGLMLKLLSQGPLNRQQAANVLWPELATQEILEDRLDKLVKRVNEKVAHAVELQGGIYRLNLAVKIK